MKYIIFFSLLSLPCIASAQYAPEQKQRIGKQTTSEYTYSQALEMKAQLAKDTSGIVDAWKEVEQKKWSIQPVATLLPKPVFSIQNTTTK